MQTNKKNKMGLSAAVSMAVGTMIGASIFSIFGIGAEIAGQNLPEAFLLSGLYAFAVAYSYSKLGTKFISNAGPITFITKAIGDNLITGTLSVLLWLTYVVSIAMFAKAFSGYFLPLFNLSTNSVNVTIAEIFVVLFFTVLNFFGSKAVGKIEFYIVSVKILILLFFAAFGLLSVKPANLTPSLNSQGINGMLHASVIFFLSYMGFGLITNASENIKNPSVNIPRAIYISISIAMLIYLLVSLTAVGNISIDELINVKENALAIAAKPFLGNFGFLLISIGALFSIASALNATLYGGANISYSLAKDGELPDFFERKVWFKSEEGLYLTAALSISFSVLLNMAGIASIVSIIFTTIYIFVLISHYKLLKKVGGNKLLLSINILLLSTVFLALLYYQIKSNGFIIYGTLFVFLGALLLEFIYRKISDRKFN
ncbi:MAG: amino acid permease [Ignavibacteriae bacterium]|nr:amino acid permease [Ignavibacteriota bacterium]NOG99196.1 amino acid permease [Ignavibacteriota bacterium]